MVHANSRIFYSQYLSMWGDSILSCGKAGAGIAHGGDLKGHRRQWSAEWALELPTPAHILPAG